MNLFVTPWISLHNSPAFKTLPVIVFLSFVFFTPLVSAGNLPISLIIHSSTAISPFAGGNGASDSPLEIKNWTQLNEVRNYLDASLILMDDLTSSLNDYEMFASASGSIIYLNDVLVGSSDGIVNHLSMSFNQLAAANTEETSWPGVPVKGFLGFTGGIDEFMLTDKSLTGNQIQQETALSQPTITSFTPTTAQVGTTVTITGTNFTGATSVIFGGVASQSFTVVSDTQITAIVPVNASQNTNVQVITAGGTATATGFVFLSNAAPTFTSTPITSIAVGDNYFYNITKVDPDGDAVTITAPTLPSWLTLTAPGNGLNVFAGTSILPSTNGGVYDSPDGTLATNANLNIFSSGNALHAIDGKIFFSDVEEFGVRYIDENNQVQTFYNGDGSFLTLNISGIQYNAASNTVYVGDYSANKIVKSVNGGPLQDVATGINFFVFSLLLDEANNKLYAGTRGAIYEIDLANSGPTTNSTVIAGSSTSNGGYNDTGVASTSEVNQVASMTFDGTGKLVFVDRFNDLIRKIDLQNNTIETIAGIQGANAIAGDGGLAVNATFQDPTGITIHPNGNIYITERLAKKVRVIDTDGVINEFATVSSNRFLSSLTISSDNQLFIGTDSQIFELNTDAILSGTPSITDAGMHPVQLRVEDGNGGINTQDFIIKVTYNTLQANDITINEGSDWGVFEVNGPIGEVFSLRLLQEVGEADLGNSPVIQSWNGSAWINYNTDDQLTIPQNGTIYVRVEITNEQDTIFEGAETFGLEVFEIPNDLFGLTIYDANFQTFNLDSYAKIGTDGAVGTTYKKVNAITINGQAIDVIISIDAKLNVSSFTFDDNSSNASRFEPQINSSSSSGSFVDFTFEFFLSGTTTKVGVKNFVVNPVDVDGSSSTNKEFIELLGLSSYQLGQGSGLTVIQNPQGRTGFTRFEGISSSLAGVTFDNTASFIAYFTNPVDKFKARMGVTGSSSITRLFSMSLGSAIGTFSQPSNNDVAQILGTATINDDGTGNFWIGDAFIAATTAELMAANIILDDDRRPSPPTNLIAAEGDGKVEIAFISAANGGFPITNYEYTLDGGQTWLTNIPAVTTSPIIIGAITNGTVYTIQLRAVNAIGSGAASASITATPLPSVTAPSAPTNLVVTPKDGALEISFTAGNNGGSVITNYEYNLDGGTIWTVLNPADGTSPVTIPGLTNGTAYTLALRAVNAQGVSAASASVTSTPATTPAAPSNLVATPKDGALEMSFTAGNNGGSVITNYEYSLDGGTTWTALNPADGTSPVTIPGLTNGTAYTLALRAVNAEGDSPASASVASLPKRPISSGSIAIESILDKTYSGLSITPNLTINDGSDALVLGTAYTVQYENNINTGIATVTINGIGRYNGTRSVNFTIEKAKVTITAESKSKVYGEANPDLTFTYSGLVNGDEKVATEPIVSATATASSNVGTYQITLEGAADANYDITSVNGTLTVGQKAVTITAESKSKVYGQANPDLTFTYSGLVNGDEKVATEPIVSATATASSNVGTYQITLEGAADANYDIISVNGTLTVGQKAVTITAENKSKTYGQANPDLTFTYSGLVNGDEKVATEPSIATTATASSNVGTYQITLEGAADANYDITLKTGELEVTKATLTITATDKSKTYGEANPDLTFTYSGLVNGDEKVATEPIVSATAMASSNIGIYPITLTGAADANYDITLKAGELEVTQATLTITANEGQSKIFGTADLAFSYIASGFAAGDDKQVLTGTLKRDAGEAVGIYPINLGSLAAGVNYQIVFTSANFEIIPAVIESVMQPAPIEIIWGVYPELPSTVTVMTTFGKFLVLPIIWDLQTLNVFGNGEYPLFASINLPSGILNTEALIVEIVVTVLPKTAPEDILLDNNSFEAKAGHNFVAVGNLSVLDPIDNQHDISLADLAFDNVYFQINNGTLFWKSAERADGRTEFKTLIRVQDRDGNILEKEFTIIRNRTAVNNIEIFNSFTPNGDNVNDTWGVEELRFYTGVRVQVFERSGKRLFYTENPDIRWDGYFNGKELPIGTYYWTIEVKETGEVRKGMLNLLRK